MSLGPLMVDVAGTELTSIDREILNHPLVGGVILFTRNYTDPEQVTGLVKNIHALRIPPLLVAVDQEGGRVQRFREEFTLLPPARLFGQLHDRDANMSCRLAESSSWLMAAELRAVGVDISFSPVLDLDYGVSSVIGDRAFHHAAEVVGELGWRLLPNIFPATERYAVIPITYCLWMDGHLRISAIMISSLLNV